MTKKATANLGFEDKLWQAADKLRGNMDPARYKHVLLGLIFLKYISDSSAKNDYVFIPGRYVGIDFELEDDEVFEEKMKKLTKELTEQIQKSRELEKKNERKFEESRA